ncbi:hypothetical protein T484DRAFT_1758227 [Baffinella frigidus]|nr:hypothetical protein T484DRAFT_1758227 [Cryptophyta sp. CCMP2293]
MAAMSLESVGPKIVDAIIQLRISQDNITQSVTGDAIDFTEVQELTTSVGDAWAEKNQTTASDQVLFSVGFLKILDGIITQLTTLTELANDCNVRNSDANTDVDTFETTALRLRFLSLAQQHLQCWKAISGTDMRDISFSSNGPKMIKFREKFRKESLEDMVAAENVVKVPTGQATTYTIEGVNLKTIQPALDELTKSTNCLKSSPYYQDANPAESLEMKWLGILTSTIKTVEEIVEAMRQVSFTPIEEAYTPTKQVKSEVLNRVVSAFYCADDRHEFNYTVQTSARLVTTTAITGKGEAGDKKMKEYFYDFIKALFGATKAQALKTELDKEAQKKEHTGMFVRTVKEYYTIKVPERKVAEQLIWSEEVRQTAADLFTRQKTVGVPKPALEDATQMEVLEPAIEVTPTQKPLQHTHPTKPAGKRTTTPRLDSGRNHVTTSELSPTSHPSTPPGGASERNLMAPVPGGLFPTIQQPRLIPKGPLKALPN